MFTLVILYTLYTPIYPVYPTHTVYPVYPGISCLPMFTLVILYTACKEKMEKNLNSFIERCSNVPYSPLTEATFIEIENLRKHIQKGCLSEIPPGCGTERNEGLHRLLNRSMISGATTLSVQLAMALLTLLFYHHNQKISAEKHFCSSKIKPVAPVVTKVTNSNVLTGNAEFETESGDDKDRQRQFSTELDIEDGKIFQISENSFASSNPFIIMVETIEDLSQESIAAALISATYNLSEMIKKVKEKNNDRSFNALDTVHLSKMTKLLTSEDNIDTDDPTINIHSETLKRHLATFNLQLDRVQSDGDCAFRTIIRKVRKLVHNEAGQLSDHLRRLELLSTEDLDTYTLRQLFVDAVLADDCSISNFFEGPHADVERKAREFSVRRFFDQEIGDFVIRLCSNILQAPIMVITSSEGKIVSFSICQFAETAFNKVSLSGN